MLSSCCDHKRCSSQKTVNGPAQAFVEVQGPNILGDGARHNVGMPGTAGVRTLHPLQKQGTCIHCWQRSIGLRCCSCTRVLIPDASRDHEHSGCGALYKILRTRTLLQFAGSRRAHRKLPI